MKVYRILVVEDDEATAQTLRHIMELASFPYEITVVGDGRSALATLKAEHFDVMLLDLVLPELSGIEVLKALEKDPRYKGFPVLINSASADFAYTKEAIHGCTQLRLVTVPRPSGAEDIVAALTKLLNLPSTV